MGGARGRPARAFPRLRERAGRAAIALILLVPAAPPPAEAQEPGPRVGDDAYERLQDAADAGSATARELAELTQLSLARAAGASSPSERDAFVARAIAACSAVTDHETRGRLVAGIADFERGRGRFEEAALLLEDAVAALDRSRYVRPLLLQMLAEVCRRTEDWSSALRHLEAAERSLLDRDEGASNAVATFHREVRSLVSGSRAQVWTELGVWEEAARALAEERRLADSTPSIGDDVLHATHQADNLVARTRFVDAASTLREALSLPELAATPAARDLLLGYLGVALAELERADPTRPREAAARLDEAAASPAVTEVSRVVFLLARADVALREGELDEARRRLDRAEALLEETSATVHENALLEAHRARLLLAAEASPSELAGQLERLERAFGVLLERWAAAPSREGSIGFLHLGTRRLVLGALVRLTLALDAERSGVEEAFGHVLAAQAKGTLARSRDLTPPSLDQVRRLLGGTDGILVYLPSRERSYAFLLDRETITATELGDGARMQAACRPLAEELLRVTDAARLLPLAHEAAESLLPPAIESFLRDHAAVTVVGSDLLFDVPLECLPLSTGELLGEARAVAHLPSLPLGIHLAERPLPPPDALDLVLVAAPTPAHAPPPPHPPLARLPFDEEDEERLIDAFEPERVRVWTGTEASAARLRATSVPPARVTHFLAHGVHDLGRERGAGLALNGDGGPSDVLFCEDVERSLRVTGLVVLSACGSALGPSRMGDDRLAHLGGAFLDAGAVAVVLSRAEIEYHRTLDLMAILHERLARGDTPAAALTAARRAAAEAGDPFFGARFQVVGLGTRPCFPPPPRDADGRSLPGTADRALVAAAIGALGAIALFLLRRRRRRPGSSESEHAAR